MKLGNILLEKTKERRLKNLLTTLKILSWIPLWKSGDSICMNFIFHIIYRLAEIERDAKRAHALASQGASDSPTSASAGTNGTVSWLIENNT